MSIFTSFELWRVELQHLAAAATAFRIKFSDLPTPCWTRRMANHRPKIAHALIANCRTPSVWGRGFDSLGWQVSFFYDWDWNFVNFVNPMAITHPNAGPFSFRSWPRLSEEGPVESARKRLWPRALCPINLPDGRRQGWGKKFFHYLAVRQTSL